MTDPELKGCSAHRFAILVLSLTVSAAHAEGVFTLTDLKQLSNSGSKPSLLAAITPAAPPLNLQSAKNQTDSMLAQSDGKRIQAGPEAITVIFPDIGEPFRSIFAKMIEGIEEQTKTKVKSIALPASMEAAELNTILRRQGTRVVIALGQRGYKLATGLDKDIAVVIGGVLSVPEADHSPYPVISLTPDPGILFSQLKNLIPGIKRVLVVYNPANNEWLIRLARQAAKSQGLELMTYEARDLASAAHHYEAVFAAADGRFDAVWLPQDSTTVEENTIMPLILKESWNRSVPIFSSNFVHVKKGALFALYPNNLEMGRNLAVSAQNALAGEVPKRGVFPLKEVMTALNVRTASRIGLSIGAQKQRSFDFIFPEQ